MAAARQYRARHSVSCVCMGAPRLSSTRRLPHRSIGEVVGLDGELWNWSRLDMDSIGSDWVSSEKGWDGIVSRL